MQFTLTALKWLALLVVAGALAFGVFVAGQFMWRHWAATLAVLYVLGALITAALSAYVLSLAHRPGEHDTRIFLAAQEFAQRRSDSIVRVRLRVFRVLNAVCVFIGWPSVVALSAMRQAKTAKMLNLQTAAGLSALGVDDVRVHPWFIFAVVLLACAALRWSSQPAIYPLATCLIAIAYVCILCLAVTVSPTSLAERLRRGSAEPFSAAVALGIVTTLILVVAYATLEARGAPTFANLVTAARGLYSQLDSIKRWVDGEPVQAMMVAEGVSGALLVSAVIQSLLSLKDFKRADADWLAIANTNLSLGQPSESLNALQNIKDRSALSIATQAVAMVGVSQARQSLEMWTQYRQMSGKDTPANDESRIHTLFQSTTLYPLPAAGLIDLLGLWLQEKPLEQRVGALTGFLVNMRGVKAAQLLSFFPNEPTPTLYPVTRAHLLLLDKQREEAIALASSRVPREDASEFMRALVVLVAMTVANPHTSVREDREAMDRWCSENLPRLTSIGERLTDGEDLIVAIGSMSGLQVHALELQSAHVEAIRYLNSALVGRWKNAVPDQDVTRVSLKYLLPSALRS